MTQTIVQINFKLDMPVEAYVQIAESAAASVAAVEGLVWKVWSVNAAEREAASIHLFEHEDAARAYLAGPIVAGLAEIPGLSGVTVRQFDVLAGPTAATRGPVQMHATGV